MFPGPEPNPLNVSHEWLTERVENAPTSFTAGLPDRAALRMRMAWQKLQRQALGGDELWAFSNPPSTWRKMGRCSGFALVREGEIVESVITAKH
jgi:hypothetical protein